MTRRWRYKVAGKVVPAVTTVLKYKDPEPLMRWAAKLALEEGIHYDDYRKSKADSGTLAHAMIEADLLGKSHTLSAADFGIEDPDRWDLALQEANRGFDAFQSWKATTKIDRTVSTEIKLVCPEHRFGGTPDAVMVIQDRLALLDWKSSGSVYGSHLVQLAAYRHLWETGERYCIDEADAMMPSPPELGQKIEAAYVLRVDKDFSSFVFVEVPDTILDLAFDAFLHFRAVYDAMSTLDKFAR